MSRGKAPTGPDSSDHFLARWSKRKHAVKRGEAPGPEPAAPAQAMPVQGGESSIAPSAGPAPLPDVETLTPESDFAPFMRADVDDGVKRRALKTLFQDPRYNVMDGLDVYIDDYSKPDPLPEGWLERLNQVARLGDYHEPEPEAANPPEDADDAPTTEDLEADPSPAGEVPEPSVGNPPKSPLSR